MSPTKYAGKKKRNMLISQCKFQSQCQIWCLT